jgi:hypothetical protein
MEVFLDEIERALQHGLYSLAVTSALTLPDICAALESPDGETSGPAYKAWYDAWLAPQYPQLSCRDMWKLRCGVVHRGRLGHGDMQYARIIFTLPNPRHAVLHQNVFRTRAGVVLMLYTERFCRDMAEAVRRWYEAKKGDPNVTKHLPDLLQFRPTGMLPYTDGQPVVA